MLTVQCNYSCSFEQRQALWVHNQEGSLQAVGEGDPGQVAKYQHEPKAIMHNIHGCQNGLLVT